MIDVDSEFYLSSDPPSIKNIVEISGFRRVRNYLDIDISNKRGNIVLIIGDRGIGKSTCLEYCNDHVTKNLSSDSSKNLNIGLSINKLLNLDNDDKINLILENIALSLTNNKTKNLGKITNNIDKNITITKFLFIDNLDRLYSEDECNFIKYLFKTIDPILKSLTKKISIYISCAPEWAEFLDSNDLSYINFSNRIELNPLSVEEIKQLIMTRAKSCKYDFNELIDDSLLPVIKTASKGNSRRVFQFLQQIFNTIDEKDLPITDKIFESILKTDLYAEVIESLKELSTDPKISWGINQLWRFFDISQKNSLDIQEGIEKIIKAHEKSTITELEIKNEISSWRKIAHKAKEKRWVLNPQVRDTITKWRKKTKTPKRILLNAFAENPFLTSKTNIEDYVENMRLKVVELPEVSKVFDDSVGSYMYINSLDNYDKNRRELIDIGWICISRLMLTLLSAEEGSLPNFIYQNLKGEKDIEAYDELVKEISSIYLDLNKTNPLRSELEAIKARYIDLNSNPELLEHWESSQMEGFKNSVTTSFEGMLGDLPPKHLERTEKIKLIKRVNRILRKFEKKDIEFKSTLRWDIKNNKKNEDVEKSTIKTISAFLNTKGGVLLIGIDDNKNSCGIENDILTLERKNIDGFGQHLMNLIEKYLGSDKSVNLKVDFVRYRGNMISIIDIEKYPYPVYLIDKSTNQNEFYIRSHNTTRKIDGNDLQKYIQNRFKQ